MPRLIAVAMLSSAVLLALAIAIPTAPIEVSSSTPEATSSRRTGKASAKPAAKPHPPDFFGGCSEDPTEEWERQATAVIGSVSFVFALVDAWVCKNRVYYIHHWKELYISLLMMPGCYALLVGMKPYLGLHTQGGPLCATSVKTLFGDLTSILVAKYLYDLLAFELQQFNMRHGGFGSTAEAIERVGKMLEDMDLPPLKLSLSAVPFWGSRYVKPGREFLTGCRTRLRFYTTTAVTLLVVKQMTIDYDSYASFAKPVEETASLWLGLSFIVAVMVAQSAKGPMEAMILPFVNPMNQKTPKWRKLQYFLLFPVATGFNAIISLGTASPRPACMWWLRHGDLFIVSILFIVVVIGHRCWVPPFHWSHNRIRRSKDHLLTKGWSMTFEAAQKSTGSHAKMMAIREFFEVMTSLNPEVSRAVWMGEKDLNEAREEARLSAVEIMAKHVALHEKGQLWTSDKSDDKPDLGSDANANASVTANPVVEDPNADILSPTRHKLLPADQERNRTMEDLVVET